MPRFNSTNFYQNRSKLKLFFTKKIQNFLQKNTKPKEEPPEQNKQCEKVWKDNFFELLVLSCRRSDGFSLIGFRAGSLKAR